MPMHDWTRVSPGTYHNFHLRWIASIMDRLNAGLLPKGYFAMAEEIIGGPAPDVVTLNLGLKPFGIGGSGGVALALPRTKPKARVVMTANEDRYARKTNNVVIRHELGEVIAIIELVSPGNKNSEHAIRTLVKKLVDLFFRKINLLVVDPFPPTRRDPQGLHGLLWSEVNDEPFELPTDRPLTIAAYQAEPTKTAYVEPIAVGEPLPTMPLFLHEDYYIDLPLEETYSETWRVLPEELRSLLTSSNAQP